MMLTPFGQIVRKHRIDKLLTLKEMADAAGVSSAFLSAVEMGRKPIPVDLIPKIAAFLELSRDEEKKLAEAVEVSMKEVRIGLEGLRPSHREAAVILARRFATFSPEDVERLKKIIEESGGKKK